MEYSNVNVISIWWHLEFDSILIWHFLHLSGNHTGMGLILIYFLKIWPEYLYERRASISIWIQTRLLQGSRAHERLCGALLWGNDEVSTWNTHVQTIEFFHNSHHEVSSFHDKKCLLRSSVCVCVLLWVIWRITIRQLYKVW